MIEIGLGDGEDEVKIAGITSTISQSSKYFEKPLENEELKESINLLKEWNPDWNNHLLYRPRENLYNIIRNGINAVFKTKQADAVVDLTKAQASSDPVARPAVPLPPVPDKVKHIMPANAELSNPNDSVLVWRLKENAQQEASKYHILTIKNNQGEVVASAAYEIYKGKPEEGGVYAQFYFQSVKPGFKLSEGLQEALDTKIFADIGTQAKAWEHTTPVPVFSELEAGKSDEHAAKGWHFFGEGVNKDWNRGEAIKADDYVYAVRNIDGSDITTVNPNQLKGSAMSQRKQACNIPCNTDIAKLEGRQLEAMKECGGAGENSYFKGLDLNQNLTVSKNSPVAEKALEEKQEKPSSFLSGNIVARGCTAMAKVVMGFKDACLGKAL